LATAGPIARMRLTDTWLNPLVAPSEARFGDAADMKINTAPYDKLRHMEITICTPTNDHTAMLNPWLLAKWLMIGNKMNNGMADAIPAVNTFFGPPAIMKSRKEEHYKYPIEDAKDGQ